MDEQERDDWGDIIDAAIDSPDAATLAVPRGLLIAVDADLMARPRPVDRATDAVMWFVLGMLAGVCVIGGYVAATFAG